MLLAMTEMDGVNAILAFLLVVALCPYFLSVIARQALFNLSLRGSEGAEAISSDSLCQPFRTEIASSLCSSQ
jgi:hypothetical protein